MPHFFDAHLDLAYMAAAGRDMTALDARTAGGEDPPGSVTFPSMRGHIVACLGTVFVEPGGKRAEYGYAPGDAEAAARVGRAQMETYQRWAREGWIEIEGLGEGVGQQKGDEETRDRETGDGKTAVAREGALRVRILVEGADPIRGPDELGWWVQRGVAAIGLSWARASRYAAGNATPPDEDRGLTDLGRAMVREMDARGVVHDLSHLSDRALDQLLTLSDRPVIASHSNVRSIIDAGGSEVRQRHLRDDTIREIGRRGGMIGVNLFSPFIINGARRDRRATLEEWAAHVDHICALMNSRAMIGLGSDMDGGFSALMMPEAVNGPADLGQLLDALRDRGWSEAELAGFARLNWERFWSSSAA